MTTKDEALKRALGLLESMYEMMPDPPVSNAIKMCREALAQKDEQEPNEVVYAFRRKGLDDFCTCDERRYKELSEKPNLFETAVFYTTPPKPTIDKRVKVKLGGQCGFFLDGNWFYLQPADEFANAALYKHTGVKHD